VLPGSSGSAKGSLYLDDGESLEPLDEESGELEFVYDKRVLTISGRLDSRLKGISTSVSRWTFSDVPNIQKVKGIRVIDSPQLESGSRLLPVHVDVNTRSAYALGNWKLTLSYLLLIASPIQSHFRCNFLAYYNGPVGKKVRCHWSIKFKY
jgi:hypothetical protein